MKKTLQIMVAEIRVSLRRKTFVLFAIALPLILGIIALTLMVINRSGSEATPEPPAAVAAASIGFVDESGLISSAPEHAAAGRLVMFTDRVEAQAAQEAGQIDGFYLVDSDYLQTGEITYMTDRYNPFENRLETNALSWVLLYNLMDGDLGAARQVWQPMKVEDVRLSPTASASVEDSWIVELFPLLMVLILYMVILIPAGSLVNSVIDEKKNRVLEVLMTSVSSEQFIVGKILALGLLGLLSAALWFGVLWVVIAFGGQSLQIPAGFYDARQNCWCGPWSSSWAVTRSMVRRWPGWAPWASDYKDTRGAFFVIMLPIIVAYMLNIVVSGQSQWVGGYVPEPLSADLARIDDPATGHHRCAAVAAGSGGDATVRRRRIDRAYDSQAVPGPDPAGWPTVLNAGLLQSPAGSSMTELTLFQQGGISMNSLNEQQLDLHVRIIGWLRILSALLLAVVGVGVLVLLFGLGVFASVESGESIAFWTLAIAAAVSGGLMVVLAVPGFVAGIGLLKRKNWARGAGHHRGGTRPGELPDRHSHISLQLLRPVPELGK